MWSMIAFIAQESHVSIGSLGDNLQTISLIFFWKPSVMMRLLQMDLEVRYEVIIEDKVSGKRMLTSP